MRRPSCAWFMLICALAVIFLPACAGNGEEEATELLSTVIISRHGIRSQTSTLSKLNRYTQRPQGFPLWPPPADVPGNLSTVGYQNAARLGAWYREFYAAEGLLPSGGTCPDAGTVFVYANTKERALQTAQAYVDGLFQTEPDTSNCGVLVNHTDLAVDPYIKTLDAGVCTVDTAVDRAAFDAATGGDPNSLVTTYAAQLQMLQDVTQCCQPEACATTENPSPTSCSFAELPSEVSVDPMTGELKFGPRFKTANTITEMFRLEYAQGMPDTSCAAEQGAQCVGWGVIPSGGLYDMMKLHVMFHDLLYRLPSFSQASATNLMWQTVGIMDQTLSGVKDEDILAPANSKLVLFVGHDDVNIAAVGAFLGVNWTAEGYQQNDAAPAGAIILELRKTWFSKQLIVKLFYVTATLDQMRNGTTLTLQTLPQRIPLMVPECGGSSCPYDQFKTLVASRVRQDCLVTAASVH